MGPGPECRLEADYAVLLQDPAAVADDRDAFAFGGHSGYVEVVAADHYVDVDLGDVEAAVARDFCVRETR